MQKFAVVCFLMFGLARSASAQILGGVLAKDATVVSVIEAAGCVSTIPLLQEVLKLSDIKPSQVRRLPVGTKIIFPVGLQCKNIAPQTAPVAVSPVVPVASEPPAAAVIQVKEVVAKPQVLEKGKSISPRMWILIIFITLLICCGFAAVLLFFWSLQKKDPNNPDLIRTMIDPNFRNAA